MTEKTGMFEKAITSELDEGSGLRNAGYTSVVVELCPMSPQDIGVKAFQEYMLNEAILFHRFDPTSLSRADLEKIGDFVEHIVPLPDY